MTQLALLFAACATTALGCADNAPTDSGTNAATGTTAGGTGGGAGSGGNGTNGAAVNGSSGNGSSGSNTNAGSSNNTGSANAGSENTGGDDAAVMPPPGDCQDDESTLGNDCPGVVTCAADVDSCSLTAQNCCVKDYNENAVSCNEGTACDGLVSAACDGREDCPENQECCISVSLGLGGAQIMHRCVADVSECKGGNLVNRILCHDDEPCASGESCEPIPNLPWWGQCK